MHSMVLHHGFMIIAAGFSIIAAVFSEDLDGDDSQII